MDAASLPPLPPSGSPIQTACRGHMLLEQNTPQTIFKGRRIYFCLSECLESFNQNPITSCLAGDPLLESE